MIQGKATLVVDLGNSETRVMTVYGKYGDGRTRYSLHSLDNHFGPLEEGYKIADEYNATNTRIFSLQGATLCSGEMCRREFVNSDDFRPSAVEKKYTSDVSRMTFINAFLQGYLDIASFENIPVDRIDVEWDVVALLPPMDIEVGAEKLSNMIKSIKEINFSMPVVHKDIQVRDVRVLLEGFCAYIGVLYDMNKKVRPEYKYLKNEVVIIFDIGAGTTDITVVDNGKPIKATRYTMAIGGNNVHQRVRGVLNERGLDLPEDVVRVGVERGYIKDGRKQISICKEISEAKSVVARSIVSNVRNFFEFSQYPIRKIEDMIVCGGGAVDPGIDGMRPIGEYLVEYMKRLSENISLVELPNVLMGEEYKSISPRVLNVFGAGVASLRD